MNRVNCRRKLMKEEPKKKKRERDKTNGGPKFGPHIKSFS